MSDIANNIRIQNIDNYMRKNSSEIDDFFRDNERLSRLSFSYRFSFLSIVLFATFFCSIGYIAVNAIMKTGIHSDNLLPIIIGSFIILAFSLLFLGSIQSTKSMKDDINIIKAKLHNQSNVIESLDMYQLEEGLKNQYLQVIERSGNNHLNTKIHKRLKDDLNQFVNYVNKSEINSFLQTWMYYREKLNTYNQQIYN